ncbi:hypothetical protein GGR56DRAFT_676593 [Xylariaceae sp. FL0804]|nr:hypothetical protein GGR56DRAFT_676593 [Xylariaceae sp. FL0804]
MRLTDHNNVTPVPGAAEAGEPNPEANAGHPKGLSTGTAAATAAAVVNPDLQLSLSSPDSPATAVADTDEGATATSKPTVRKVCGLLLLPQELLDEITSYLPPANILALAMINKEVMKRFLNTIEPGTNNGTVVGAGDAVPQMRWKALSTYINALGSSRNKVLGGFLSLLDYDLLDLVYCYKCKRLHNPFVTFRDRAFEPRKSTRCIDWAPDHHMPPRATRKLLRSITKYRMQGADYRPLLQQVNNTVTVYQAGSLAQASLRLRYRGDALLLRRRQVVSSVDKNALALAMFRMQLVDPPRSFVGASSTPKVYRICNHLSWHERYAAMVDRWSDKLCYVEEGQHNAVLSSGRSPSLYPSDHWDPSHSVRCFMSSFHTERAPVDLAKQEGHAVAERLAEIASSSSEQTRRRRPTDVPPLLGCVQGCDRCTTDFSLDVAPLPAPFHWGFVLTTWLDLGSIDFCRKWDSHRDLRPGREWRRPRGKGLTASLPGDICARFEDLAGRGDDDNGPDGGDKQSNSAGSEGSDSYDSEDSSLLNEYSGGSSSSSSSGDASAADANNDPNSGAPWLDYRPHIGELDLKRMGNYGWAERAVAGQDRYVAWRNGHHCDPATGLLRDPDPLEDADY